MSGGSRKSWEEIYPKTGRVLETRACRPGVSHATYIARTELDSGGSHPHPTDVAAGVGWGVQVARGASGDPEAA